jgi:hypothetical protein
MAASGGSRSVSLADVSVNGSLASINAPSLNITGGFFVSGQVKHGSIGSINGGTFSTGGNIGNVTFGSLTNANVFAGATPGADLAFAGAGDTDNTFTGASIGTLVVKGAIAGSIIAAGVDPADGVFANGNDIAALGAGGSIASIRAGSVDAGTVFESSAFGTARIPAAVDPATDPHFVVV